MTLELVNGRRYGYRKDVPDFRDLGVGSAPLSRATDPAVSNIALMGAVLDQGQEGSCTAHAAVADREFLHWKELARRGQTVAPDNAGLYSPAFTYYVCRMLDGSLDEGDCGSYGRTTCRAGTKYGFAHRADMPYTPGDFDTAPTDAQYAAAKTWLTGQYHRLSTVQDMKDCIASGYNFRIGFTVYESFENIGHDGLWKPKKTQERVLGGHEVLAIGYRDDVNGGSFQVRNSWGESWGDSGNFWFRYSDAADSDILMDAWISHLGRWS